MTTYTFRLKPSTTAWPETKPDFTIEAETASEACMAANVHFGYIPRFYAWNDEGHPGDYTAMYGVWD